MHGSEFAEFGTVESAEATLSASLVVCELLSSIVYLVVKHVAPLPCIMVASYKGALLIMSGSLVRLWPLRLR